MLKTILAATTALALLGGPVLAEDEAGFPEPEITKETRIVISGRKTLIYTHQSIDKNCRSIELPEARVAKQPTNGTISVEEKPETPNFKPPNVRVKCNKFELPSTAIYYTPNHGFTGTDYFSYTVVFSDDTHNSYDFKIVVR